MADADGVLELLTARLAAVLAIDPAVVTPDARFDEDLQADSLDLVEVIEGVEQDLRGRGIEVSMSDDELATLQTVGDAAGRLAALARPAASS